MPHLAAERQGAEHAEPRLTVAGFGWFTGGSPGSNHGSSSLSYGLHAVGFCNVHFV